MRKKCKVVFLLQVSVFESILKELESYCSTRSAHVLLFDLLDLFIALGAKIEISLVVALIILKKKLYGFIFCSMGPTPDPVSPPFLNVETSNLRRDSFEPDNVNCLITCPDRGTV
ncbi:hypothetical protein NPIL_384741 [Nephila pilipes]|uniref:Uncharacterized protein n=1 Tax=Nephila pilipes TaxID=299642 RepID=A0A8X6MP70_NEPPI|nr:hypothetical protein NPIL_384741 [Nephila pilipes]